MKESKSEWIGEIVEWSDPSLLSIEVYPAQFSSLTSKLLQAEHSSDITLLAVLNMRKLPLDPGRKTFALNMDEDTIKNHYPQQSLFVKQYLSCSIIGSIADNHFHQTISAFGIGVHTRVKHLENQWMQWLVSHESALFLFLSSFSKDDSMIPLLKEIGKQFLDVNPDPSFKHLIFKQLSMIFKEKYFILKDLIQYLQS